MVASNQEAGAEAAEAVYVVAGWQAYWGWENFINYNLNATSGNTTLLVEQIIPGNGKVRIANGSLVATPHNGLLREFSGTTTSASSIEYAAVVGSEATVVTAGESTKTFIIDFGGIRKVSALVTSGGLPDIVMVLPWMGIEFGSKSIFPYSDNLQLASVGVSNVSFPEVETAKLLVQFSSAVNEPPEADLDRKDEVLDNLSVISKTMPLNVKVAVGNRPPFHTFAGELKGEVPLPEFSSELNAYLDEVRKAGAEEVENFPLMITMDAPGQVNPGSFQIVYDREAEAKWGDLNRQSINFERQGEQSLQLGFQNGDSNNWRIHSISLDVINEFPQWRAFPRDTVDVPDKISASVSSDFNIAQCLTITETTDLFGLGLFVSISEETSELLIEIQQDNEGVPDDKAILEENISINANEKASWIDVMFSKPLPVIAGKNLWFVIKSKVGELSLVLDSASSEKPVLFNRNGAGYRGFPYNSGNVAVVFRQFRKPAIGENAQVISLTIDGQTLHSDLTEDVNTVTFSYLDPETGVSNGPLLVPENSHVTLDMKIEAHASGSMTFQKVIAHYQHSL